MSDKVTLGKVIPLKGKDEQGRPIFSGSFDFHDDEVEIGKEQAKVQLPEEVLLNNVALALEGIRLEGIRDDIKEFVEKHGDKKETTDDTITE